MVGVAPGGPEHMPAWTGSADAGTAWQAMVDDAVAQVAVRRPEVPVRGHLDWGAPADALVAASASADLLVVGARGSGGFAGLLLGSVADRCLHRAAGPVAVVRAARPHPADGRPGRVVVGVDGSDDARVALCWAAEEARVRGTALEAVIAWQYPPTHAVVATSALHFAREADQVGAQVRADVSRWAPGVPMMVTVVDEAVVPALLERSVGAGLLVVGPYGQGGYRDRLLGSVATQCSHHAPCPVVVVHCWELPPSTGETVAVASGVDVAAVVP